MIVGAICDRPRANAVRPYGERREGEPLSYGRTGCGRFVNGTAGANSPPTERRAVGDVGPYEENGKDEKSAPRGGALLLCLLQREKGDRRAVDEVSLSC